MSGLLTSNMSNSSVNEENNQVSRVFFSNTKTYAIAVIVAFFVLSSIVTTVGNGLVIVIIARIRRLRTAANLTILNLACCDFVIGCSLLSAFVPRHTMPQCAVFVGYVATILVASMEAIALCTTNRYVAIAHPLRYSQWMTTERTRVLIVACLLYAIGCGAASTIQATYYWNPSTACVGELIVAPGFVYFIASHYAILFVVMMYCYISIVKIARDHARRIAAASVAGRECTTSFHATWKTSKIMLMVVGSSWTLLAPHVLHMVLIYSFPSGLQTLRVIRTNALLLNSLINPIIYFYKYKEFRSAVRELFGCRTSSEVTSFQPDTEQEE
ncbi:PREDICTED: G-protein coupled receptor 6-like [Priapulus caudatus]|uniref:G-protein coupled receptor 6-like n=1 Tax=Priapulus caudatus TaxID=37621 RepID=A0ABM1E8N2_PRICU|nr:PREDICTED: G-protein coupled receptor 6-like [Priapulus caudatus]